jgi:hypothetical protein
MGALAWTATAAGAGQPLGGHVSHLIAAVGFLAVSLGGVSLVEARQRRSPRTAEGRDRGARSLLVVASAVAGTGAAAVHAVVMPAHVAESILYGAFFAVAAATQLGFSALLLWRPTRALVSVGVAGNAAMIGLWLMTRLVAVPLGPAAGETETVGGLDVVASVFELAVVVLGTALLVRVSMPRRSQLRALLTPVGLVLTALAAVAVSVTAVVAPPV